MLEFLRRLKDGAKPARQARHAVITKNAYVAGIIISNYTLFSMSPEFPLH